MSDSHAAFERVRLERAIFEHLRLPVRSDQHQDFLKYYVDDGHLQQLLSGDWQVIQGRRGTGKTILLGALHDTVNLAASGEDSNLALMFTAYDFRAEPLGVDLPDVVRGLGYFQVFLDDLAHRLNEEVQRLLARASWTRRIGGYNSRKNARIQRLLQGIIELAQKGIPVGAFSSIESAQTTTRDHKVGHRFEADDEAGVDDLGMVRFGADLAGNTARRQSTRSVYELVEKSPAIPRFGRVRRELINLLDQLEVTRLYLLIDEWASLDPTATSHLQPLFAELLKTTFGGTNRVSVKIGAATGRLRLEAPDGAWAMRGLELGADIFPTVDLDRPVSSHAQLGEFFSRLLTRRLSFSEPLLASQAGVESQIFSNTDAFRELVTGSEGIPRRFLRIFNKAAEQHSYQINPRWTLQSIQNAIVESLDEEGRLPGSSPTTKLLEEIESTSRRTGSRVFTIRKEDRPLIEDQLLDLLERRLIHANNRLTMTAEARERFEVFRLDYGIWLSFTNREIDDGPQLTNDGTRLNLTNALRMAVHTTAVDSEIISCRRCGYRFSRSAREYDIAGLCPQCLKSPFTDH
jgi:hypothetical protein